MQQKQLAEGREGEIWFHWDMPYVAGKTRSDKIVRTKYLIELQAIVTGLTETTADGRLFGAIEISDMNGKPIGNVGTGFDRDTQRKIVERFAFAEQSNQRMVIPVVCQEFTEYGQAFHARLDESYE